MNAEHEWYDIKGENRDVRGGGNLSHCHFAPNSTLSALGLNPSPVVRN
jgi:hypothetical protein